MCIIINLRNVFVGKAVVAALTSLVISQIRQLLRKTCQSLNPTKRTQLFPNLHVPKRCEGDRYLKHCREFSFALGCPPPPPPFPSPFFGRLISTFKVV